MNPTTALAPWLQDAWLRRYLDRELTAEETEWFEAYMLDKPEVLERVEADLDLRDGLAALPPAALADAARATRPGARPASRYAQAAGLALALGLGWGAATLLGPGGAPAVDADPLRIVFDTERGGESPPLTFNTGSRSRFLLVEVGVPPDASAATLTFAGQAAIPLQPTSEGFVTFLVPRELARRQAPPVLRYRSNGDAIERRLDLSRIPGVNP